MWWCNSTVDQSCVTSTATASPRWATHTSRNVTDATDSTPLLLTLVQESARAEDAGLYFCTAWMESSADPPSSVNITVNVNGKLQTTTKFYHWFLLDILLKEIIVYFNRPLGCLV